MKEADGYWHKQGSAPPKKDNFAKLKVVRTTFLSFCETKETCEINKRKHIQHTRPLCYFAVFQSTPSLADYFPRGVSFLWRPPTLLESHAGLGLWDFIAGFPAVTWQEVEVESFARLIIDRALCKSFVTRSAVPPVCSLINSCRSANPVRTD